MTYPPEIKAKAVSLFIQGYSSPRVVEAIEAEYAESPSRQVVDLWRQELAVSGAEQDLRAMDANRDIVGRAQRLVIDTLDMMKPDPKSLTQLATVAGIFTDKIHQSKQLSRGPDIHQHLHLLIQQAEQDIKDGNEPLLVEGEIDGS